MWHYCEYVPGVLVEGGQLYYCCHCADEQFVPDPKAGPDPALLDQLKSKYSDDCPF